VDELLHEGDPVICREPIRIPVHQASQLDDLLGQSVFSPQFAHFAEHTLDQSIYTVGALKNRRVIFWQRFFSHVANNRGVYAVLMNFFH